MPEKVTKTVKVPESKAADWEDYVEENAEVDSISHLIRLSVQKEISGEDYVEKHRRGEVNEETRGEVRMALRKIQTTLGDVEERLAALERVDKAESNYDLQKAIFTLLPEEPREVAENEIPTLEDPAELNVMTAQEIAQSLGADESDVEETLDELVATTGQVQRSDVNHDGRHYWKKGR